MFTPLRAVVVLLALPAAVVVASSCVAPRRTTLPHPSTVLGGEPNALTRDDDGVVRDPERADCTPAEEGLCVCVPGGFESGDETWDFACCFDGAIWVSFCGDVSAGCDPETFTCLDAP